MQIDDLTIGQARALAAMFAGAPAAPASPVSRLIGQQVIVRSRDSGVHYGKLEAVSGRHVTLTGSRRLWYWIAAKEHTLSAVALHGLKDGSKIASALPVIEILDACEIIPVTPASAANIEGMASHDPR